MSKVAITGNASGTGTLTIAAPNTNTDRTLTLPDTTGAIVSTDSNGNLLLDRGSITSSLQRTITIGGARNGINNVFAELAFQNYDSDASAVDYVGASITAVIDSDGADGGQLIFNTSESTTSVTERMRIDSVGRVTKPYQPAFFAYGSGTAINSGADNKLEFGTELFDVGSNYSTSTNRFTAPVSGVYFIKAAVRASGTSGSNEMRFDMLFTVNGSGRAGEGINQQNSNDSGVSSAVIMSLSQNDYVEVWVTQNSAANGTSSSSLNLSIGGTDTATHFCGYLIG